MDDDVQRSTILFLSGIICTKIRIDKRKCDVIKRYMFNVHVQRCSTIHPATMSRRSCMSSACTRCTFVTADRSTAMPRCLWRMSGFKRVRPSGHVVVDIRLDDLFVPCPPARIDVLAKTAGLCTAWPTAIDALLSVMYQHSFQAISPAMRSLDLLNGIKIQKDMNIRYIKIRCTKYQVYQIFDADTDCQFDR